MKGSTARCLAATLGAAFVASLAVDAQAPASPPPAPNYVASVKPADPTAPGIFIRNAPGRLDMSGVPAAILIRQAYQVQDFQVIGAPSWVSGDRFNIEAKIEGDFQPGQMPLVMQGILKDRFGFVAHRESREMPLYALTLARSDGRLGPGLKPSSPECTALIESRGRGAGPGGAGPGGPGGASAVGVGPGGPPPGGPGGPGRGGPPLNGPPDFNQPAPCGTGRIGPGIQSSSGFRIAQLLSFLSQQTGRSVVDRTGLTGIYDIELKWTPEPGQGGLGLPPIVGGPPPQVADPNAPTLITALQEQLGLKLESQRGPVDVLVVDKMEKPQEN